MQKAAMSKELVRPQLLSQSQLDWIPIVIAAPLMLFASHFQPYVTLLALFVLAIPFAVRFVRSGSAVRYTPVNWLVGLLLFVFVPLSFVVSPLAWAVSWPRAATLIWSIALFFTLINSFAGGANGPTHLNIQTRVYLGLGAVVALLGIFGMRDVDKLFSLSLPHLLAFLPGMKDGLATNEVAGVLTLFIPLTAALAFGSLLTGRKRLLLVLSPVLLVELFALVLSQSRTGLTGTTIALLLVLLLVGRPNRWWLVAALALGGAAVLALYLTGLSDEFVYAGANSWSSVITPRLLVWQQGLYALRNFPIWGIGLGTFGLLAPRLYPQMPLEQAKILEDAHNLYLQNGLDFGLVGGLVVLAILLVTGWLLIKQVQARPRATLGRALSAGLLASLIAHMLYSFTDAVALGTLAGIPLWFLLGLSLQRTSRSQAPERHWGPVAVAGGAAVLLVGLLVSVALPVNWGAMLTADAIFHPAQADPQVAADVGRLAERNCELLWHQGLLYHWRGEPANRDAAWDGLLQCTGRYTHMMKALAPANAALAQKAIAEQSLDPTGYFWLAEIATSAQPDQAIALYKEGLDRAPEDGLAWQRLADLLVEQDPEAAMGAYLQSCENGDPGANGCLRAGELAERQGDTEAAIRYYRMSKYSGAQERAAELESAQP